VTEATARQAGVAMRWRAIELAGVKGIYFLRLLVLAQLLAPDAFGLVAIGLAAIGIVMRVSDLGMVPALVQRPDPTLEEYNGAWTIGLTRAVAVAVLLGVFAGPAAALFGEPGAAPIIRVLALRPVIDAAASIGVARLTRQMRFGRLAMIAMPVAVVDLAVALGTAHWLGVWALVAGALAGAATNLVLSYVLAPHRVALSFRFATIAPLVRFGRWILLIGILVLLRNTVTQVAVSRLEGVAALGLYFLAMRVAFLPADIASAVVSAVAFPMFAKLRADEAGTARAFRTLLTGQAIVLVPGYAIMLVLAPALEGALGENWHGAAPVIQILAISGVTGLLGELALPLLKGRGRADRVFKLEVVQAGVLVAVLLPLVVRFGAPGAALAWLTGNVAALVVVIVWLRTLVPGGLKLEPAPLLTALAAAAAGAAAAAWGAGTLSGMAGLLLGAGLGLGAAAAVLFASDRWLELNLWELANWIRGARRGGGTP